MNIVPTIRPKPELPLAVQPRQGPLHDPTVDPQTAAMFPAALPQERLDPEPTQPPPHRLGVVGPVAIEAVRAAAGPTRLAAHRGDGPDQTPYLRHFIDVGGGRGRGQRHPLSVGDHVVLAPLLTAVHRAGAGLFPSAETPRKGGVDGRPRPVDLVGAIEFGQQDLVKLLPDAGGLPVAESA